MKALVLRNDIETAAASASALQEKGFQVACVCSTKTAHSMIKFEGVDLLVMDETVDGRLTHALALSAERRNPYMNIMLVTDRSAEETDDLYKLIPCLYALVGTQSLPSLMAQLAMATAERFAETQERVDANERADEAEKAAPELTPQELADIVEAQVAPEPVLEVEQPEQVPDLDPNKEPELEVAVASADPVEVLKDAAAAVSSDIDVLLPDLEELADFNTHVDAYRQIAAMAARPFSNEQTPLAS